MARLIAITLALSLVIGVVLFVQHDEARMAHRSASQLPSSARQAVIRPPQVTPQTPATQAIPGGASIYRCENSGETVFSDRPCGNVVAQTATLAPATNPQPVRTYREQYNNLVANRPVSPKRSAAVIGMTTDSISRNEARCESLHKQIADIDAQARQRNTSQRQERLRAERRKVQDQIYREC